MRFLAERPGLPTSWVTPSVLPPTVDTATRPESSTQVPVENVARKGVGKPKKSSSHPKKRDSSSKGKQAEEGHDRPVKGISKRPSADSSSAKSDRSQRVDLVVEDRAAEEREREQARREGGATWNETEHRRFVLVTTIHKCFDNRLTLLIVGRTRRAKWQAVKEWLALRRKTKTSFEWVRRIVRM